MSLPDGPVPVPPGALSFAAADKALVNWLAAAGFESVSTDGPDKAESWPHIQVTTLPTGSATLYKSSSANDVEVFHPNYDAAANAAGVVHYWVLRMQGQVVGEQNIDDVRGPTPGYEDYDDPTLKRFMSTYTVESRPINPL